MRKLYKLCFQYAARDFTLHPERFLETEKPAGAPKVFPTMDPVDLLRHDVKLPSLPQVVVEIQEVINKQGSSSDDIADVISRDPGLSAFLLRMVNSAFYSYPSQIETVSRAVTVVGTKQLSILASGTSIMNMFKDVPVEAVNMELFWKHCIACGAAARSLATMLKRPDTEKYFVAGLLHDIGRLAMFRAEPERARAVYHLSADREIPMTQAEKITFGFTHAKLGGMLLRKWNFPFSLIATSLHHHGPTGDGEYDQPDFIHVADTVVKALGFGASGEFFIQTMSTGTLDRLGLDPDMLTRLVKGLEKTVDQAFSVLIE